MKTLGKVRHVGAVVDAQVVIIHRLIACRVQKT
jgi:hypothetical protein